MEDKIIDSCGTCFSLYSQLNIECKKTSCRHWLPSGNDLNCTILSARKGPKTLQQIGDIFSLTRMRVCQLEKSIVKKIQHKTKNI